MRLASLISIVILHLHCNLLIYILIFNLHVNSCSWIYTFFINIVLSLNAIHVPNGISVAIHLSYSIVLNAFVKQYNFNRKLLAATISFGIVSNTKCFL